MKNRHFGDYIIITLSHDLLIDNTKVSIAFNPVSNFNLKDGLAFQKNLTNALNFTKVINHMIKREEDLISIENRFSSLLS